MKLKRTHSCGELTLKDEGKEIVLCGWVHTRRDHGGVIFIDLRDRYGLTQVVFNPKINSKIHKEADKLRLEYVIAVRGKVDPRPQGMRNPKMKTGEIEITVSELEIFSTSKTLPFMIEDQTEATEPVRLKHRYLDLRRPKMQKNFMLRHQIAQTVRNFLSKNDFLELETPFLIKSTPEGARDYVVPSRVNPGYFYALPQSPQIYKQLFMISGFERYFQIVRCFRDEDLRADRQPEFTQIDIVMSFIEEEDILNLMEEMTSEVYKTAKGVELPRPLPRLSYVEAMDRYGVDKPDTRFGLELKNISDFVENIEFKVFASAVKSGGLVKAINLGSHGSKFSRKDFDDLAKFAAIYGAKGLAWIKVEGGQWKSPIAKFFKENEIKSISQKLEMNEGHAVIFIADQNPNIVNDALGHVRVHLGKKLSLIDTSKDHFCWVIHFPMFEFDPEENRYVSKHHPFTAPADDSLDKLESDPAGCISKGYDLVLNGTEVAGGSIRIHNSDVQKKVFQALKISDEEAKEKFGFLLEALQFGAPPHGGIAFGFDRLIALLCGEESIREVIAFPKTQKAQCLMSDSPGALDEKQLKELHLKVTKT